MTNKWRICLGLLAVTMLTAQALAAEQPATSFHVKASDLPKPFATLGVENSSKTIPRPPGAMPLVPKGFEVSVFASGLKHPRFMELAPNGDIITSNAGDGNFVETTPAGKQVAVIGTEARNVAAADAWRAS